MFFILNVFFLRRYSVQLMGDFDFLWGKKKKKNIEHDEITCSSSRGFLICWFSWLHLSIFRNDGEDHLLYR